MCVNSNPCYQSLYVSPVVRIMGIMLNCP
ncbi:hypothetical protein CPT_Mangalyan_168 [Escherichia phage Mangalyan]|nr:hypothetical protein CPT_Mangalyan_168 [Escherichia phage Mangalyan]